MNTINREETDRLIRMFLEETPQPTVEDWKRLINQYPQHSSAIADAALVRKIADINASGEVRFEFDEQLAARTVSKALNLLHQIPSSNVIVAKQKIDAIKGPGVHDVAIKIGIGPYPGLLNGVLSGRTKAPYRVLGALADYLQVSTFAMVEIFRRAFAASEVPAFKARHGQPVVNPEPATWEQAVRALDLPQGETVRLLNLSDESEP